MKKSILILVLSFCLGNVLQANDSNLALVKKSDEVTLAMSKLKKLKRVLQRNLVKDNLIPSKSVLVKIELPTNQVIVNGKALEGKLLEKYEKIFLQYGVEHGEKRGVHFNPEFIKVGDFYETCFLGEMEGRAKLNFCDSKKAKQSLLKD